MLLEIDHTTEYTYAGEVFLEPHFFRFRPKESPHSSVKSFSLHIEPEPSGISEYVDAENNHLHFCWFSDTHKRLRISAKSKIRLREYNPFDFLVHPPEFLTIPFEYDHRSGQLLKPMLSTHKATQSVMDFLKGLLRKTSYQSLSFLTGLTREINEGFALKTRESGNPHQPYHTFEQKNGSCRDLAWMQIHMLRTLGIASRFVSGYYYVDIKNPEFELHAWVEAYLPGAGWIGLDPGHGILTNHFHIPVASSAFYEHTMPVSGTVRGDAKASLKKELKMLLQP